MHYNSGMQFHKAIAYTPIYFKFKALNPNYFKFKAFITYQFNEFMLNWKVVEEV